MKQDETVGAGKRGKGKVEKNDRPEADCNGPLQEGGCRGGAAFVLAGPQLWRIEQLESDRGTRHRCRNCRSFAWVVTLYASSSAFASRRLALLAN